MLARAASDPSAVATTASRRAFRGTMCPGTYFGPVEEYLLTDVFVAVLVRGWWINVWKAADGGFPETDFAFKIPEVVVKQCCTTGI